jgi:hypothetical protein
MMYRLMHEVASIDWDHSWDENKLLESGHFEKRYRIGKPLLRSSRHIFKTFLDRFQHCMGGCYALDLDAFVSDHPSFDDRSFQKSPFFSL